MAGTNPRKLDPYAISVTPANPAVAKGKTVTFQCVEAELPCAWDSDSQAVGTVGADGVFTAVAEGTAVVTAPMRTG